MYGLFVFSQQTEDRSTQIRDELELPKVLQDTVREAGREFGEWERGPEQQTGHVVRAFRRPVRGPSDGAASREASDSPRRR